MIDPKNPIRDPGKKQLYFNSQLMNFQNISHISDLLNLSCIESKKRKRVCGNRMCGLEGFGNDGKQWSRRKIDGKQCWFCKRCSDLYSKNQYCEYCLQIYETEEELTDGKMWV